MSGNLVSFRRARVAKTIVYDAIRSAWIGLPFPLDMSTLPLKVEEIPLSYPSMSRTLISTVKHPSTLAGVRRTRILSLGTRVYP